MKSHKVVKSIVIYVCKLFADKEGSVRNTKVEFCQPLGQKPMFIVCVLVNICVANIYTDSFVFFAECNFEDVSPFILLFVKVVYQELWVYNQSWFISRK